jgi:hypothetical protein
VDPLQLLLGGVGGGLITASVNYYIYRKSRAQPTGKAYELLKGLKKVLGAPQGEHFHAKSAKDNYYIANHIYAHADGRLVATAFHEDPATYGQGDLIRGFSIWWITGRSPHLRRGLRPAIRGLGADATRELAAGCFAGRDTCRRALRAS